MSVEDVEAVRTEEIAQLMTTLGMSEDEAKIAQDFMTSIAIASYIPLRRYLVDQGIIDQDKAKFLSEQIMLGVLTVIGVAEEQYASTLGEEAQVFSYEEQNAVVPLDLEEGVTIKPASNVVQVQFGNASDSEEVE